MVTLIVSTHNPHKLAEIQAILGTGVRTHGLRELPGAPVIAEDAPTFAGNARLKAVGLAAWLTQSSGPASALAQPDTFVLADDSGLEVDALGGVPGVQSARFAAVNGGVTGNSPDADNNAKLLSLLAGVPPARRTARFRCVLALTPLAAGSDARSAQAQLAAATLLFEGACEGRIGGEPRGRAGFGYDPLFTPHGYAVTFAELGEAEKNRISHRAKALTALRQWLEDRARPPAAQDASSASPC